MQTGTRHPVTKMDGHKWAEGATGTNKRLWWQENVTRKKGPSPANTCWVLNHLRKARHFSYQERVGSCKLG